jgi:putative transposase
MKKSRFSENQIVSILSKYGGMDASMMARMKELEEENRRLKKMYAEERLKAEIIAEAMQKKW